MLLCQNILILYILPDFIEKNEFLNFDSFNNISNFILMKLISIFATGVKKNAHLDCMGQIVQKNVTVKMMQFVITSLEFAIVHQDLKEPGTDFMRIMLTRMMMYSLK